MVQLIAISLTVSGLTSHQISLLSQTHTLDTDKPPKVSLDGCLEHCATVTARLTMSGAGGSGKSVLINTIASVVRKAFGRSDAVHVCGPTGSAAFNAGGVTMHRLFGIAKRHTTKI